MRSERWGYLCCGYFSGESYSSKHSLTRGTRPQSSRVSNVVSRCPSLCTKHTWWMDSTAMTACSWPQSAPPRSGSRRRSKPKVSHLPHTQWRRTSVGRAANLPFAFRSSPDERQQRLLAGSLRKLARTMACTARRHTGTAAGLFELDEPTNAMCSSHRRLCARARSTRGDTRQSRGARHALCCAIDPGCRLPIVVCG